MSYERMHEYLQQTPCACGKGTVVRTYYYEMNDWSQTHEGYENWNIQCANCKLKYHIETITRHFNCPSWEGDGIITDSFLVPFGKTLHLKSKFNRSFSYRFNDCCVSDYPLEVLKTVIADMKENKYSTRLTLDSSKRIVNRYFHFYKKRSLPAIINILQECVDNYSSYEWTYEKEQEYKRALQKETAEHNQIIKKVLSESFPLDFKQQIA